MKLANFIDFKFLYVHVQNKKKFVLKFLEIVKENKMDIDDHILDWIIRKSAMLA